MMEIQQKVQVWIYHGKGEDLRVLLLRTIAARGAFWQPVTGGVEPGETPQIAALREATEETGFQFSGPPVPLGYSFEFEREATGPRPAAHVIETCFALHAHSERAPVLDPREHEDWRWIGVVEAQKTLKFESNREALRRLPKLAK